MLEIPELVLNYLLYLYGTIPYKHVSLDSQNNIAALAAWMQDSANAAILGIRDLWSLL